MKEFIGWIKWAWTGLESWKRWFLFAMLINFTSALWPAPYNLYVAGVGMCIVFGHMLKWFVWDQLTASWDKYREHRNELFSTIKTSDKE